jgi:hypothetical protein
MSHAFSNQGIPVSSFRVLTALFALLLSAPSCSRTQKAVTEPGAQKTFTSPEEAGAALMAAASSGDQNALIAIFGPDSKAVLFTGDAAADSAKLKGFITAYSQMHRWGKIKAGGQVLYVGADNFPFPIPVGQNSSGQWYFDTAAGKDEILARRIGKNELTAMDASAAIAGAQDKYFRESHDGNKMKQYAQKFASDPGKHNGLYWPVAAGQPESPLGRFGDFTQAVASTTGDQPLFNGYYYRVLAKPGDFAILAYPAEYRNSGIMTFIVGKDGAVYQKDLGETTRDVAKGLTEYNPADGWSPATHTGTASRAQ